MAINHVNFFGQDLIDLRTITVHPYNLLEGVKALDSSGEEITGTIPTNSRSAVYCLSDGTVVVPEGYYPYSVQRKPASVDLAVPEIAVSNDGTISVELKQKAGYVQGQSLTQLAYIPKEVILNMSYPVGSVYMSFDETDPGQLFGGTWERIKDAFLLAAGDTYAAGSEGGEAEHTLNERELPSLSGAFRSYDIYNLDNTAAGNHITGVFSYDESESYGTATNMSSGTNDTIRKIHLRIGGDQPHNNMPPYIAVYMWKRTA